MKDLTEEVLNDISEDDICYTILLKVKNCDVWEENGQEFFPLSIVEKLIKKDWTLFKVTSKQISLSNKAGIGIMRNDLIELGIFDTERSEIRNWVEHRWRQPSESFYEDEVDEDWFDTDSEDISVGG